MSGADVAESRRRDAAEAFGGEVVADDGARATIARADRARAADAILFTHIACRLLRGGSSLVDVMSVATMSADSECEVRGSGLRELRSLASEFAAPVTDDVGAAILASLVALAFEVAVNERGGAGLEVAAARLVREAVEGSGG